MNHSKALDLARRYHFVLMDIISSKREPSTSEVIKTFRLYEKMINKLYYDKMAKDFVECLEKLPTHENWVHLTGEEMNRLSKELELPNE